MSIKVAMIITQAPVRISFLGGGTDFRDHFERHGGAVLATAIDRFAYVAVQKFHNEFFDHGLRIAYRKTEAVRQASEVEHPAIRACLQKLGIEKGVELHHLADLPARTGLGSSSSFIVAMLLALHAFLGRIRSPRALADEAIEVERRILAEAGGHQDQVIAAFGGTCLIRFERSGSFNVTQLPLSPQRLKELQEHMLLLYTGIQRDSHSVLRKQMECIPKNHGELCKMSHLAEEGAAVLADNIELDRFGELLHKGWELKRQLSDVSLPCIDEAYEIGRRAGASGGKLLGAGQGGFLLFIARPEYHTSIREALPNMRPMSVGINAHGCRIIFSQGNE